MKHKTISAHSIGYYAIPLLVCSLILLASSLPFKQVYAFSQNPAEIFINEIHFQNIGDDVGEAVELAGPAETSLYGWRVVLYDGFTRRFYENLGFSTLTTFSDQSNGLGSYKVSFSQPIRDSSAVGVALVSGDTVIQFLSYKGQFTALDGPAAGLTSTQISVQEDESTAAGTSLQLTGTGRVYQDFSWASSAAQTFGAINTGQTITAAAADLAPDVVSTAPQDMASSVDQAAAVVITFSEPVFVNTSSFNISCGVPVRFVTYTITQNASGTIVTLLPSELFRTGEFCSVTIYAARLRDQDTQDPPNGLLENYIFSFRISSTPTTVTPTTVCLLYTSTEAQQSY